MAKLLKIELKKIMTYKVFWILMGLYFLFLILGILMAGVTLNSWIDNINKHSPIPFPHFTFYFFHNVGMFFQEILRVFPSLADP